MPVDSLTSAGPLSGHVYAVGVGPGAPDLITVRAANIIKHSDVLICPRSSKSIQSMALEIIRPWIKEQMILDASYPMRRDAEATEAFWRQIAERAREYSQQGRSVTQITLGDPLIYSTSCYFLLQMQKILPGHKIHIVPGIAAFQAVSARLKNALAVQEDRMLLMPGTDADQVRQSLACCETLILYKAGRNINLIRNVLEEEGLLGHSSLICYAEQENEFVCRDLTEYDGHLPGYLASIIVHVRRRKWRGD
ncbi:MAG: precorrin-2 C(20)-methyltransferase [Thermodesulfobacteriota bacterium]